MSAAAAPREASAIDGAKTWAGFGAVKQDLSALDFGAGGGKRKR